MNQSEKQWKDIEEKTSSFWIHLLLFWTRILSRNLVIRLIAPGISLYYSIFANDAIAHSRSYLQRVLDRKPTFKDTYRHFYTFAVTTIDRIYLLSGKTRGIEVVIENKDQYQKVTGYKSAVMISSHLGSFEILRILGDRDVKAGIHILLDIHHNQKVFSILQRIDRSFAEKVIDAGRPGPEMIVKLQQVVTKGGIVGIMGDRLTNEDRALRIDFLSGEARFPQGPWVFSLLLGVPIVVCFGLLDRKNRYHIYIDEIPVPLISKRAERQQAIMEMLKEYVGKLEHHIENYPYNWFNFYSYWEDGSSTHT